MLKRILLALALVGAMAACTTPASTTTPGGASPTTPVLESPSDVMESPSDSGLESEEASPSAS